MAGNRKALCVGINVFQNYPDATLQGCVNDVESMASFLKKHAGFSEGDIVRLTDAQATKKAVMGNLKTLVADAKAGKLSHLVFTFSSHGTQVPDLNGDEPDRADEAFCPHDLAQSGNQWDRSHVIVDDELNKLFTQVPPGVLVEVFLDTCHSGTGLKAIDLLIDRKPRYLPPPSLEAFAEVENRSLRGMGRQFLERGLNHQILWAACRSDQTSADAKIGGGFHGAFTYYFCKVIDDSGNRLSRKAVLQKVRAELKANRYTQVPQLECPATAREIAPVITQKASRA